MTRNMHMLTSKNPHFVANKPIPTLIQERYLQMFYGETTPEDICPFNLCCDNCKYWKESHGCYLGYKEGGKR